MPLHLHEEEDRIPHVSTGSGAPSAAPAKVGDIYVDTTNKLVYIAVATGDAGDWELMN